MITKGFPLFFAAIMTLLQFGGERAFTALSYQRVDILQGEWWRLISCHFIHMGWPHLVMNLLGLLFVWLIAGKFLTIKEILTTFFLSVLFISLGLWVLKPDIVWYIGSSGVLHGFWAAAAIVGMRKRYWESYAFFILLVAKLFWEQALGPLPSSVAVSGVEIVVAAHLYGALGGFLQALFFQYRG